MKSFIKYLILTICLLLVDNQVVAQSVSYRNLTTKDGLPSNTIYQIKQDKKGFIWIATANGLVRYDGKYFELFNPKEIKDKEIIGLFIDNQDKVWFWNLTGRLFLIQNDTIEEPLSSENIQIKDFCQDKNGHYYFIEKNTGLFRMDNNHNYFLIFKVDNISNFVFIYDKKRVNIYCKQRDYLFRVTPEKVDFLFKFYEPIFGSGFISSLKFKRLNNTNWISLRSNSLIYKVDEKGNFESKGFQKYRSLLEDDIENIFFDDKERYWVFTKEQILIFDKTETQLIDKIRLPKAYQIEKLFFDHEGNIWISAKNKGILIIPSIDLKSNFSNNESIVAINIINNKLIVSTNDGSVKIYDKKTSELLKQSSFKDQIIEIIDKSQNEVWFIASNSIYVLDKTTFLLKKSIGKNKIAFKTLFYDRDSSFFLIGNYAGVLKIPNNIEQILKPDSINYSSLNKYFGIKGIDKRTYAIEKVNNEFWFGTTNGLYYSKNDAATLTTIPELQKTWITNIINQNDTVWIGTQTDGLFQVIDKKIVKIYNKNNGLISNNCKSLIIENGIVWIGTNSGINRINLKTNEIELVNNLDGLPENNINALTIDNQKIYIGTSEGLTSFDKTIQTKNTVPPPIYLSKFQIFENDTILSDNYNLNYNDNNIRIHFTGVSFRSQGTFKYKYRMLGISDKWIETQTDFASYPILNPGDYVFEAFAINEDGVESETPIQIKIHIQTPFWKTWWFISFSFLAAVFIIWGILWYRFKQIEAKLELEKTFQRKLSELEMQALQSQMNPHFIFNVLNSIQHYLAVNNGEQAMLYLSKFAKLIRVIFEYSKKTTISLTDELEFLNLYTQLEQLRFKNKVAVQFDVATEIYTDEVVLPPLLIQPIIENTFKHGFLHKAGKGNLTIKFFAENELLKCSITDDGVGRKKAATMKKWKDKIHQSSGLTTTQERLTIWFKNQNITTTEPLFKITDLEDETGTAIGTQVEIILNTYLIE